MPAEVCAPQIQACAIRVTKLYASGVPRQGSDTMLVSDDLVSLAWTAEQATGDEFQLKNACGANKIDYKDCDRLRRLNLTLSVATPSPYLSEFLAGGAVLIDGEAVGYAFPTLNDPTCPDGISVELWARRITSGGSVDPDFPWNWYVLPKVFLQVDSGTFENGPYQPSFTGFAVENENWHDGPLNDWPVASTSVMQNIPTTDLPTTACAPVAVPVS